MKFAAGLMLLVLAACALNSRTADIYEYNDRQWLIYRSTTTDDGGGFIEGDIKEARIIALRQQDGSYTRIADSYTDDSAGYSARRPDIINDGIRYTYLNNDPNASVTDLLELIQKNGRRVSTLIVDRIEFNGRTILVPEEAIRKPKAERQEDGGMY